jgi:MFS family permease
MTFQRNAHRRVLTASLLATTIEFYEFFIYATAAAVVFGPLFFPASAPVTQSLGAWGSFALAFFARPLGAILFGHLGDRHGRRWALGWAIVLMGVCTVAIGLLPTHGLIGWWAALILCLLRFGQGLGLGGHWGGAVLLATDGAPKGREGLFGAVPQLGAPIGFLISSTVFLGLGRVLGEQQFVDWGWRIPFLLAAPLTALSLWARLGVQPGDANGPDVRPAPRASPPLLSLLRHHTREAVLGTVGVVACFVLYYLATAFALSYATTTLGFSRHAFLIVQIGAIPFMAIGTLIAGWLCARHEAGSILLAGALLTIPCGLLLAAAASAGPLLAVGYLCASLFVLGIMYGPLGSWLPGLFPVELRYTGASVAFNVAGVIGGAMTPLIATYATAHLGLQSVGLGLAAAGALSSTSVLLLKVGTGRRPWTT